jgi:hypothetical protein
MSSGEKSKLEILAQFVQVISVVGGVLIAVGGFNEARKKEASARKAEAERLLIEARQRLYLETARTAAVLAAADLHTPAERDAARRRFRELYIVELSMFESPGVESGMVTFAQAVDPGLLALNDSQKAALALAHVLGRSFAPIAGTEDDTPKR